MRNVVVVDKIIMGKAISKTEAPTMAGSAMSVGMAVAEWYHKVLASIVGALERMANRMAAAANVASATDIHSNEQQEQNNHRETILSSLILYVCVYIWLCQLSTGALLSISL